MKTSPSRELPWGSSDVSSTVMSGRVGGDAGVEDRIVGQCAVGPEPHVLERRPWRGGRPGACHSQYRVSMARGRSYQSPRTVLPRLHPLVEVGQRLGLGQAVGHRELVVEALLGDLEAGRQPEDRPARAGSALTRRVVKSGRRGCGRPRRGSGWSGRRAAGSRRAGSARRGPRSTVRAAATSAWPATWPPKTRWRSSSGDTPAEDVDLDRLEVQQLDQVVHGGLVHRAILAGGEAGASGIGRSASLR